MSIKRYLRSQALAANHKDAVVHRMFYSETHLLFCEDTRSMETMRLVFGVSTILWVDSISNPPKPTIVCEACSRRHALLKDHLRLLKILAIDIV